jgi:hypothetical protein
MKAQADSSSRGRKGFMCREEKRKTAWWGMQGDLESDNPVGQGGDWILYLFCVLPEGRDAFQMQMGVSWEGEVSPWPPAVHPSKPLVFKITFSAWFVSKTLLLQVG